MWAAIQSAPQHVFYGIAKSCLAPAALVAGFVLVLTGCTQPNQQATNSPEATPSVATTTPSASPTPADSPTPQNSPSPVPSPSPAKLIIRSVPFHMGEVGLTYGAVTLVAAGGVKPYKWSVSSGALPGGVTLSSKGSATGKPTAAGTFRFVVRVDDSAGAAAGVPSSIFVFRQIAFAITKATCVGSVQSGCIKTLNYSGGASGATPKLKVTLSSANAPLPAGSTFTVKAGVVTVSIAGPQCQYLNGFDAIVTLVLVDQSPCSAGYICSSIPATVHITLTNAC
jgi:hypothetical protein